MKRLQRIQKIYEMRVELARRDAGAAQQVRLGLEEAHAEMGATLAHELDACDSIERAPFDFAARYYRATADRMHHKEGEIAVAAQEEIAASDVLRARYQEKKEFDIYASRRESAQAEDIRQKENEKARQYFDGGVNEFALSEYAGEGRE